MADDRAVEFAEEFVWLYQRAAPLDSDIVESFRDAYHNACVFLGERKYFDAHDTSRGITVHYCPPPPVVVVGCAIGPAWKPMMERMRKVFDECAAERP